ncbi:MAG TPA: ribokinase [Casimicrobiaceae bacterium]|jgi:ribokinase|nr:ribokinase [Casimicrobiaceae bacterium]
MIVVFGSLNVDIVVRMARLPAPGETVPARDWRMLGGGKGANQALAARRAGADVAMIGHVGSDALAQSAISPLSDAGVDVRNVGIAPHPTGIALIEVDAAGENTIGVVPGANAATNAAQVDDGMLTNRTTLVMQLEVPLAEVITLAARARQRGARVLLNAAPAASLPRELVDALDVLVVNQNEARQVATGLGLDGEPALCEALGGGVRLVVVTLGSEGARYAHRGKTGRVTSPRVDVVDSVGAGDAFTGALAAALDRGADVPRAMREAVAAGALACTATGAQAALPRRDAIAALADTLP